MQYSKILPVSVEFLKAVILDTLTGLLHGNEESDIGQEVMVKWIRGNYSGTANQYMNEDEN